MAADHSGKGSAGHAGQAAIQVSVRHHCAAPPYAFPSRQLRLTAAVLKIYCLPLGTRKGEVATGAEGNKAVDHSRKVLSVTGCRIAEEVVTAYDYWTSLI